MSTISATWGRICKIYYKIWWVWVNNCYLGIYILTIVYHLLDYRQNKLNKNCLKTDISDYISYFDLITIPQKAKMSIPLFFERTRRYGPLRRPTSSSCSELQPLAKAFFALGAKKELILLFWPILGLLVVTLILKKSNKKNINIFFAKKMLFS